MDARNGSLFSYVDLESRAPQAHPLRVIRGIADAVLVGMSHQFTRAYAPISRPSIAPEKLLRALLLQALYTIRSERQLVDRIDFVSCFAGSSASASTTRCGMRRLLRRTATGSSRWMRRRNCWPAWSIIPTCAGK